MDQTRSGNKVPVHHCINNQVIHFGYPHQEILCVLLNYLSNDVLDYWYLSIIDRDIA